MLSRNFLGGLKCDGVYLVDYLFRHLSLFVKGCGRSERPGLPSYDHRDSFIVTGCGSQTGRRYRRQNITQRKHKNTIKGDNKRGKGDGVGLVGASIEMLSVPARASELTVTWTGKG